MHQWERITPPPPRIISFFSSLLHSSLFTSHNLYSVHSSCSYNGESFVNFNARCTFVCRFLQTYRFGTNGGSVKHTQLIFFKTFFKVNNFFFIFKFGNASSHRLPIARNRSRMRRSVSDNENQHGTHTTINVNRRSGRLKLYVFGSTSSERDS